MSLATVALGALKWVGLALLCGGGFAMTWLIVARPGSLPYRLWSRYVNHLEAEFRLMLLEASGLRVAQWQVAGLVVLGLVDATLHVPGGLGLIVLGVFAPVLMVERMKKTRVAKMERQLNGFTVTLSNALKTTPALGDALRITGDLVAEPLQGEIVYAVKAMRFGASVDQALMLTASRIRSADFDVLFSALLIGRSVGGDLPSVLDSTSASLREMARLHQVVASKTAEGKAQIWVLAIFPLLIVYGFSIARPGYYDVMTQSTLGYSLLAFAGACWVGAIVIGRKIMSVDV